MAQATRKKNSPPLVHNPLSRGVREGVFFVFSATAIFLFIALLTYQPTDPGWSHSSIHNQVVNMGGLAGAWFADLALSLFGYFAYLFPIMVAYAGWLVFKNRTLTGFDGRQFALRILGFVLTIASGSAIAKLHIINTLITLPLGSGSGGVLGDLTSQALVMPFNFVGATIFLFALFLAGVALFTGMSWFWLMDTVGRLTLRGLEILLYSVARIREYVSVKREVARRQKVEKKPKKKNLRKEPRIDTLLPSVEPSLKKLKARQGDLFHRQDKACLPSLSLLDKPIKSQKGLTRDELSELSRLVELKLQDFNIEVEVMAVHPGPVITRFELQPAPGIKGSQITNLAKDLARALSLISVRVVDIIPGKPYIGLEIPNEHRDIVSLSEVLGSQAVADIASPLVLALGKDISGHPMAANLEKMPHLLVAGTTGSGKSVALNSMVLSILYNATPDQVRMIMIDPKMLELSIYADIPHLLAPVVTDMKDAANALRWCVAEMDRRYRLLSALGTRSIGGYNRRVVEARASGEPLLDPIFPAAEGVEVPELDTMPFIVIIIDELADMMMVVGKKVEELIARLAQKARAAGVHLIIATQRPSVDVLTGLIKANIPTRIAFQVSSRVDSRTILDQMGAEQLLGHGDMLYLPPGTAVPTRIHGTFVDDHEVHNVVDELKKMGQPEYIDEILEGSTENGNVSVDEITGEVNELDDLYDMAVRIVTETRKASISYVQRRLKIGYNRAARMVEEMERQGVVGTLQSNGSREVLAPAPPKD